VVTGQIARSAHALRRFGSVVLVVGLVLASCGDTEEPSQNTPPDLSGPTVPQRPSGVLLGRQFVGSEVSEDGAPRPLVEGSMLRVSLSAEGTIAAGAGCNNFSGRIDLDELDDGTLRASALGSTEMACSEALAEQEQWFADRLVAGMTWEYVALPQKLVLSTDTVTITLADEALIKPDVSITDTAWRSDSLISDDVISNAPTEVAASLLFRPDGSVEVSSGCNTGTATWTREEATLSIEALSLTRKACGGLLGEIEAWLLDMLGKQPLSLDLNGDRLTLVSPDGVGMSFIGAPAEPAPPAPATTAAP
jgi:heat shock protein HslJ